MQQLKFYSTIRTHTPASGPAGRRKSCISITEEKRILIHNWNNRQRKALLASCLAAPSDQQLRLLLQSELLKSFVMQVTAADQCRLPCHASGSSQGQEKKHVWPLLFFCISEIPLSGLHGVVRGRRLKDRVLHTCAVSSQRNDSTLPNKVNQLLLGADCRINSYSIWSFGRNLLKFLEIWFNEETLLTAWHG